MRKAPLLQRLRAKKAAKLTARVGVTWYTEDEWSKVKATAADPQLFEETYADWLAMATEALREVRNGGVAAEPIPINADDFSLWCQRQNKINNAAARAEFVSEILRNKAPE